MNSKHRPEPHYSTDQQRWWTGNQWVPASPPPPLAMGLVLAALVFLALALAAGLLVYAQTQGVT